MRAARPTVDALTLSRAALSSPWHCFCFSGRYPLCRIDRSCPTNNRTGAHHKIAQLRYRKWQFYAWHSSYTRTYIRGRQLTGTQPRLDLIGRVSQLRSHRPHRPHRR
jgi:hypothetical protein